MKKIKAILLGLLSLMAVSLSAQYEREAIEEVINEAYVNGSFNNINLRNIELGFSTDFRREVLNDNDALEVAGYYDWLREVKKRQNNSSGSVSVRYLRNDIRRGIARVVLQFLIDNKTVRNEYFTLMEFPEGWKIVSICYQKNDQ